jgi:2-keto-4-pentenoate hydratase/2-oxohepta-3-ene-1,7-dioic acid hydratase in catechol pathway
MKIVQYSNFEKNAKSRLGILLDNHKILDPSFSFENNFSKRFHNSSERAIHFCPPSLHALLNLKERPLEILEMAMLLPEEDKHFVECDFKNYQLNRPLDKIETYRDFFTHEKHVATGFKKRNEPIPPAWFEIPAFYKGSTVGFIGPNETIPWPSYTDQLDYELELGVVIGKDGKNIKAENAYEYIFGFTILNDISARDIQRKEMSIRLGPSKGKDFCSVIGPVIVTSDEFNMRDPNLKMTAKINGQLWSEGFSGDSHYSWGQMLEFASKDEWLLAGDFLGQGTVGTGCGLELDRWIKPGDVIELEIEKIGILKNIVGNKNG